MLTLASMHASDGPGYKWNVKLAYVAGRHVL
jgi:hypothetical protein